MGYLNEDGLATLVGKVKGQVVQLTSAEYRNLPDTKLSDNKTYFVTDEDYAYAIDDEPTLNSDNLVKSGGVYTYTSKIGSGTLTTTAQTIIPAINELDAAIDTINAGLSDGDATYVKFPDGTMITHTTHAGIKSGDRITYPQQFVSQPHVFFSTNYNTATTIRCVFTASNASNTGFDIYAWDTVTNAVSTSTTLSVNVLAIGRWK